MSKHEHFPNTNDSGQSQGLLRMLRNGHIFPERPQMLEVEKRPDVAWLFDIDGVLTDPELKIIKHPEIIDEIITRLQKGEPVGGNTGRSAQFAGNRFLNQLEKRVAEQGFDKALLNNVYVIGEKGGVWLLYNENGERKKYVDESLATPEFKKMQTEVRKLIQEKFSDIMFFDETKETMITAEMNDGKTIVEFGPRQAELVPELRRLLEQHHLESIFRVDATRIATDIENPELGKAMGARQFVELLLHNGVAPQKFIAFGDSASDYEMAEELHRLKQPVEFVFVGGKQRFDKNDVKSFPTTFTERHCDDGTIEYLRKKN